MAQPTYPIAKNAHDALKQVRDGTAARAAREREAGAVAGSRVAFVTENIGPLYEKQESALAANGQASDDPAVTLVARLKTAPKKTSAPLQPMFKDGMRWPKRTVVEAPVWQLSVSYWKPLDEARGRPSAGTKPARALRRKGGESLTADEVLGLTESPMLPIRPQKALDFGLFDYRLPENPDIVIADE